MAKFNIGSLIFAAFFAYIGHSLWTLYSLFHPPLCSSTTVGDCLQPFYNPKSQSLFELRLYLMVKERASSSDFNQKSEILRITSLNLSESVDRIVEIDVPERARKNGSLYLHSFLLPVSTMTGKSDEGRQASSGNPYQASWYLQQVCQITTFMIPVSQTIQLISSTKDGDEQLPKKSKADAKTDKRDQRQTVNHWRSVVTFHAIPEPIAFDWQRIPPELMPMMKLKEAPVHPPQQRYLPIFHQDQLSFRVRDLQEITAQAEKLNLTFNYRPISVGKLRLLVNAQHAVENLKSLGFSEKDVDEVKGIFVDTNFYFLALTFFIAAVHLLLDFLAFKNDVNFWRNRKTMTGLSTRTVIWRCFSQFIIFLYLLDEDTSLLVLIPAGIGTLIELWKIFKAFKIRISWSERRILFGDSSTDERLTDQIDSQGMRYLAYLMVPLCIAGAGYSLVYVPHKSWISWIIQCAANGVYAFGFLFMLPQLFVNHKLKSVAHLPWRAFMYKAFNTFIDDLFAFIITMPTAHRMACFRDDVVFLIYLYQRWLYPVDKTRVNEFGESFEDSQADKKTQ